MRAVRFHEYGSPEVLSIEEVDRPDPAGHNVLVEIRAAGVNPVDTYLREGDYEPNELPMTPGVDFAGVLTETSEHVEDFEANDRVYGTGLGREHHGGYAEYALAPTDRVVHLPDAVGFEAAGGAGVVAVTAWRALVDHAGLDPGGTCLIHGGSGGVGHAAIQLASATGARVVGIGETDPQVGFENDGVARSKDLSYTFMSVFNTPDLTAPLRRPAYLMGEGRLEIDIARTYDLEDASEAQRAVLEESHLGKLLVVP